jgi:hypothetical protein
MAGKKDPHEANFHHQRQAAAKKLQRLFGLLLPGFAGAGMNITLRARMSMEGNRF